MSGCPGKTGKKNFFLKLHDSIFFNVIPASTTTSLYERLTATGNQTEVASAGAHNARYWDGDSWEED